MNIKKAAFEALEAGDGTLRLAPNWIPFPFGTPGRRLSLRSDQYYPLGADKGGVTERNIASTMQSEVGKLKDATLSYVVHDGKKFTLKEAVQTLGGGLIGEDLWNEYGRWPVFSALYDYKIAIPFHLHPRDEHAEKVGKRGKPEGYYYPPQLNQIENDFPYTFFGLNSKATREDIRNCLKRWAEGDNHILDFSRAYRIRPGTGWLVQPGILHAPGSLVTFEPQLAYDCNVMFQSMVGDEFIPRDFLVADVPEGKHEDLDYLVELIDWEANTDPYFKKNHYLEPITDHKKNGYSDRWVVYGSKFFSAKELSIESGEKIEIKDKSAYGLIVTQGRGKIGPLEIEKQTMVKFEDITKDEVFVTKQKAVDGVEFENTGHDPLVTLRFFGPDNPDAPQ